MVAGAANAREQLHELTTEQEATLVSDSKPLLVAVCALNQWTAAEITSRYRLTEPECVQRRLRLDRMRLIDLLPGNRIRLNLSRRGTGLLLATRQWEPDLHRRPTVAHSGCCSSSARASRCTTGVAGRGCVRVFTGTDHTPHFGWNLPAHSRRPCIPDAFRAAWTSNGRC